MADSSADAAKPKKKARGRPFAKGKSGNPGGKAKTPEALRLRLRSMVPAALDELEKLIEHGEGRDRIAAIKLVLERTQTWAGPQPCDTKDPIALAERTLLLAMQAGDAKAALAYLQAKQPEVWARRAGDGDDADDGRTAEVVDWTPRVIE